MNQQQPPDKRSFKKGVFDSCVNYFKFQSLCVCLVDSLKPAQLVYNYYLRTKILIIDPSTSFRPPSVATDTLIALVSQHHGFSVHMEARPAPVIYMQTLFLTKKPHCRPQTSALHSLHAITANLCVNTAC